MNSMDAVDEGRLRLVVERLTRASEEARTPIIHAQQTVTAQLSSLNSIRLHYQTSVRAIRNRFEDTAKSERNDLAENVKVGLLAQLNEVHAGDMEPEDRTFLEHSLEYYRRRFLEGK